MTFESFDLPGALLVAALINPPPQEPSVAAPNVFAARLAAMGYYGPFRVRGCVNAVIVDRADHPFEQILPVIEQPGDRRAAAEIACIALNRLCGFPDTAVVNGPDHVELAAIVSLQQSGRPAAAAE